MEEKTELELINELQDAITESLRKTNESQYVKVEEDENMSVSMSVDSQQLNGEIHENNLELWSPNDIDLTEELNDNFKITLKRTLSISDLNEPAAKRQKICGPKCKTKVFERVRKKQIVTYEPHSLMVCVLNHINKLNVPDFYSESSQKIVNETDELEVLCYYCDRTFPDMNLLAMHEGQHLRILIDEKIDNPAYWNPSRKYAYVRNKWLRDELQNKENDDTCTENSQDEECEELLVPITKAEAEEEEQVKDEDTAEEQEDEGEEEEENEEPPIAGEIVLINTKPTVNGVPLSDISKDDRRYLFKTILISGLRRKFCPLCRFIFKDNWAIELHYFSSACYYTCKYCGIRFNKQRSVYDDHVREHQSKGDSLSTKIYASRKKNDPIPKVIQETKIKTVASVLRKIPKIKPIKMKKLLQRRGYNNSPPIKKENVKDEYVQEAKPKISTFNNDANVQSKAYFCRKCFKVFFKLEEFNIHVTNCTAQPIQDAPSINGSNNANIIVHPPPINTSTPISSKSNSESESYTSSGRPLRNCVKEVSYNDEIYDAQNSGSNSPVLAFECNYCSCTFPTFQSRNSHMRIHKNRVSSSKSNGEFNQDIISRSNNLTKMNMSTNISNLYPSVSIKEEPMDEDEMDLDMSETSSSIANVSITPISSTNTRINPEIMRLVQNNPNLTIKTSNDPNKPNQGANQPFDESRIYRCSSCSKPFTNKSMLYFHKKNQCGGSRFPCPFCKKRFGTEAAYSSHIFYSHPE